MVAWRASVRRHCGAVEFRFCGVSPFYSDSWLFHVLVLCSRKAFCGHRKRLCPSRVPCRPAFSCRNHGGIKNFPLVSGAFLVVWLVVGCWLLVVGYWLLVVVVVLVFFSFCVFFVVLVELVYICVHFFLCVCISCVCVRVCASVRMCVRFECFPTKVFPHSDSP